MERAYDQAKYGEFSRRPYIDMVIPTLTDPSVAPPGKHILSCFVQYAPYKLASGTWDDQREAFGDTVDRHDRRVRAEHPRHHPAPAGADAARSRARVRPDRRQHLSGRADARTAVLPAPGAGLGAVRDADAQSVDVRVGDASRRRHHGRARDATPPGAFLDGIDMRATAEHEHEGTKHKAKTCSVRSSCPSLRDDQVVLVHDVVIIGGGHNGLVAAAFLAKAGLKPLVLERAERVGGCAITSEIAPGFRCPTLAHRAAIDPAIVRALDLDRHGLQIIRPEAHACAPTLDGRALVLWADAARAAREIAAFSARDAERYPRFLASVARGQPGAADAERVAAAVDRRSHRRRRLRLLKAGRRFRALGKADAYRLLRWMPMAVADLAGEWFESEPLRATIAAGGLLGIVPGPAIGRQRRGAPAARRRRRTSDRRRLVRARRRRRDQRGARRRGARGRRRDQDRRRGSGQITVRDEAATGVVLSDGESIAARCVVSNADPKRTLLGLVDPAHLAPEFRPAASAHADARDAREGELRGLVAAAVYRRRCARRSSASRRAVRPRQAVSAASTRSSARSTRRNTAASPTSRGSS